MNCPKCTSPVNDDALFCSKCGCSMTEAKERVAYETDSETMEKTMTIPVIRPSDINKTNREDKRTSADAPASRKPQSTPAPANPAPKTKATGGNSTVMTFVLVFLITLVIGLAIALVLVLNTGKDTSGPSTTSIEEDIPVVSKPIEEDEEEPEEETPTEEGQSQGVEEKRYVKVDTGFAFEGGLIIEPAPLTLKTLKSTEYGYECSLPAEFVFSHDNDGEIRYMSEDRTAYVDIGAYDNSEGITAQQVKDIICDELGAGAEVWETGEGYFVLRCVRDSVVYYYKYFADEYIRYMELVYPVEYSEIYNAYFEDMAPRFIKTN